MNDLSIVILSTADYRSDVWTNKQHLARGLARERSVIYIESLGLREPTVRLRDIKRVLQRLGRRTTTAFDPTEGGELDLTVITPLVIPFHRFRLIRLINRLILDRSVRRKLNDEDYLLWTFSPLTYGLEQRACRTVYHSVDLLHSLPGVPERTLLRGEAELLAVSDAVIASSVGVRAHLHSSGRDDVHLWENVAQVETFRRHAAGPRERRVIFAGNLTPAKIDLALLTGLADAGVRVDVAGPLQIDGTSMPRSLGRLLSHSNVRYLGKLDLEELAVAMGRCQVGLIPYLRNDYTEGVYPMKVHEYLAAGLLVVSTDLPSLEGLHSPGLERVTPDGFVAAVQQALDIFSPAHSRAASDGSLEHSWTRRVAQAAELVDQVTLFGRAVPVA
jgi:glycosyltransferase involved in cell wall biosynthesis